MSAIWLERPASWSPGWAALSPGSTATRAGSCSATAAKDTSRNDGASVAPGAFLRNRRCLAGRGLRRHLLRYAAAPALSAEASGDVRRADAADCGTTARRIAERSGGARHEPRRGEPLGNVARLLRRRGMEGQHAAARAERAGGRL